MSGVAHGTDRLPSFPGLLPVLYVRLDEWCGTRYRPTAQCTRTISEQVSNRCIWESRGAKSNIFQQNRCELIAVGGVVMVHVDCIKILTVYSVSLLC